MGQPARLVRAAINLTCECQLHPPEHHFQCMAGRKGNGDGVCLSTLPHYYLQKCLAALASTLSNTSSRKPRQQTTRYSQRQPCMCDQSRQGRPQFQTVLHCPTNSCDADKLSSQVGGGTAETESICQFHVALPSIELGLLQHCMHMHAEDLHHAVLLYGRHRMMVTW